MLETDSSSSALSNAALSSAKEVDGESEKFMTKSLDRPLLSSQIKATDGMEVVEADEEEKSHLSDKLLMSVEKAQKTSSELLEDLRMRRVKARVKDASAALDAALGNMAERNGRKTKIESSTGSKITGGGRRAPPSIVSSSSSSSARSKVRDSSNTNTTADVVLQEPTTKEDVVVISPTAPERLFERHKKSVAARASAASTSGKILARTSSSPAESMKDHKHYPKRTTLIKSSSSTTKLLQRSDRYSRPVTLSSSRSTQQQSKENLPNSGTTRGQQQQLQQGEDADTTLKRKKKVTVPKPFTFTSRRKAKATPKHIRNQRDALRRRRAREQGKGTRQTRFF